MRFQHLGYFLEYHSNGKFIGTVNIEKADRDIVGYDGRQKNIATETIIMDKGRKIKKGVEYTTYLYPLCGKVLK